MRRKIIVSLVLIAGLLALGASIARLLVRTKPVAETTELVRPALLVRVVTLEPQTVVESSGGYGTAPADRYARRAAPGAASTPCCSGSSPATG